MADAQIRIEQELQTIATEKQVSILYACESGSRAWGFASDDSDYDVRFLYVRPKNAYLRLDFPRDVIELPIVDDLDINGWDIFKALRLLRKSNPPLLEWLFSPIIYQENSGYIEILRNLARQAYSTTSVFYHYRHMSYGNYHQYIQQKDTVLLKKYLYVLRPMIALIYLEQNNQLPPTDFLQTIEQIEIEQEMRARIQNLIDKKKAGIELGMGAPDSSLNTFIEAHLEKWNRPRAEHQSDKHAFKNLDHILLAIIEEFDRSSD